MKTTNVKIILSVAIFIALIIFTNSFLMAQNARMNVVNGQERKEKVQTMKVAFLTDKLNLSAADAEKFWPIYNEFQDKKDALQKAFRQKAKIAKEISPELLTAEQADELINAQLTEEQSQLDLRKEYLPKFKKLIGSQKVVAMYVAERDFNKILLQKLKGRP
jgi:hypothetical protein